MEKKGKLELTWVGKNEEEKLESRVLIEDTSKSYGNHDNSNMLIHGDNLLALKSLEMDYAGMIKCVYIDPPFNTRQAFENYDDNIEESLWLSLMNKRLQILYNLLSEDGTLFIHIDDENLGYLQILTDSIFGRKNRLYTITFKQGAATGHKAINPGCVTVTNFILMYAKNKEQWNPNKVYTARAERDTRYGKYILNINDDYSNWKIITLMEAYASFCNIDLKTARKRAKEHPEEVDEFVYNHARAVIRTARPDYKNVGKEIKQAIDLSIADPERILKLERTNYADMFFVGGERILFYADKFKEIDGELVAGNPLTTLWDDLLSNNLHNEGGVSFPKGKKPEGLLKRVFELSTNEGDYVLDCFLGSGTTAAVAHKMNRKWIGIEMGEQCYTHCKVRLDSVIDNRDSSGITKAVDWKGGGGYRFFELAEPLLIRSEMLPVYQINPSYTWDMVCQAICKIEGFKYCISGEFQGFSSENRFIHITEEFVNMKYLVSIMKSIRDYQSILIYCKRRQADMILPDNVQIKKIPKDLLDKCSFEYESEV